MVIAIVLQNCRIKRRKKPITDYSTQYHKNIASMKSEKCVIIRNKMTERNGHDECLLMIITYYISFSWRFDPEQLTISAFNHEGTNPEQQESYKYN